MKKPLLLAAVLLTVFAAAAQTSSVQYKSSYEKDFLVVRIEQKAIGTYSTLFDYYEADDFGGPFTKLVMVTGLGEAFRVKRISDPMSKPSSLRSRSFTVPGDARSRKDTNFVYRLPYSALKGNVRVNRTYSLRDRIFGTTPDLRFVSYIFRTDKGDTVFAARKGLVISIINKHESSNAPDTKYSNQSNGLTVQHDDGTIASYYCIEQDGFLVSEGQTVWPDTPLGIAGSFDATSYRFYFNVTYPVLTQDKDQPLKRCYYEPVFATTEGNRRIESGVYVNALSHDLITAEMTSREKKAYEKRKQPIPVPPAAKPAEK